MNPWVEHYAEVELSPWVVDHVGEVPLLGHTADELRDLVWAKDGEIAFLTSYVYPLVLANAPGWYADRDLLLDRYARARKLAMGVLNTQADLIPAGIPEGPYQAILLALQQRPPGQSQGDLADLLSRYTDAGGDLTSQHVPQPTARDHELEVMNATTKILDVVAPGLPNAKNLSAWAAQYVQAMQESVGTPREVVDSIKSLAWAAAIGLSAYVLLKVVK